MSNHLLSCCLVAGSLLATLACDEAPSLALERELEPGDGWLELGQGVHAHEPISDGDTLEVYLGAQHLVMFALTLRLGGIEVPDNPANYTDERAPVVDIGVEIPGFEADGGYFRYVEGFPLALLTEAGPEHADPSYAAVYIPVIFPDELEPEAVFGASVTVHARVRPASGPSLEVVHTMVIGDSLRSESE